LKLANIKNQVLLTLPLEIKFRFEFKSVGFQICRRWKKKSRPITTKMAKKKVKI